MAAPYIDAQRFTPLPSASTSTATTNTLDVTTATTSDKLAQMAAPVGDAQRYTALPLLLTVHHCIKATQTDNVQRCCLRAQKAAQVTAHGGYVTITTETT
eukprot:2566-Heterococcus_DN1.PRE.2